MIFMVLVTCLRFVSSTCRVNKISSQRVVLVIAKSYESPNCSSIMIIDFYLFEPIHQIKVKRHFEQIILSHKLSSFCHLAVFPPYV
jgi:hypothetical protein